MEYRHFSGCACLQICSVRNLTVVDGQLIQIKFEQLFESVTGLSGKPPINSVRKSASSC